MIVFMISTLTHEGTKREAEWHMSDCSKGLNDVMYGNIPEHGGYMLLYTFTWRISAWGVQRRSHHCYFTLQLYCMLYSVNIMHLKADTELQDSYSQDGSKLWWFWHKEMNLPQHSPLSVYLSSGAGLPTAPPSSSLTTVNHLSTLSLRSLTYYVWEKRKPHTNYIIYGYGTKKNHCLNLQFADSFEIIFHGVGCK